MLSKTFDLLCGISPQFVSTGDNEKLSSFLTFKLSELCQLYCIESWK